MLCHINRRRPVFLRHGVDLYYNSLVADDYGRQTHYFNKAATDIDL